MKGNPFVQWCILTESEEGVTAPEVFPCCRDLINILQYTIS